MAKNTIYTIFGLEKAGIADCFKNLRLKGFKYLYFSDNNFCRNCNIENIN